MSVNHSIAWYLNKTYIFMQSKGILYFFSKFQVNIFQHASFYITGQGKTELNLLRLAVTNSVIDPWIYILFRKESLVMLLNLKKRLLRINNSSQQTSTSRSGLSENK